jgi:hypothetical protein
MNPTSLTTRLFNAFGWIAIVALVAAPIAHFYLPPDIGPVAVTFALGIVGGYAIAGVVICQLMLNDLEAEIDRGESP